LQLKIYESHTNKEDYLRKTKQTCVPSKHKRAAVEPGHAENSQQTQLESVAFQIMLRNQSSQKMKVVTHVTLCVTSRQDTIVTFFSHKSNFEQAILRGACFCSLHCPLCFYGGVYSEITTSLRLRETRH